MTDLEFITNVCHSNAGRLSRDAIARTTFSQPELFNSLLRLAINFENKCHYKACWTAELVIMQQPSWMKPHLEALCQNLHFFSNQSALRSLAKICWSMALHDQKEPRFLSALQCSAIVESCFDWLIGDVKVATKVYAMRTLFEFGKKEYWIFNELKPIIENGYANHSAAYRAAGRDLIIKIAKQSDIVK